MADELSPGEAEELDVGAELDVEDEVDGEVDGVRTDALTLLWEAAVLCDGDSATATPTNPVAATASAVRRRLVRELRRRASFRLRAVTGIWDR